MGTRKNNKFKKSRKIFRKTRSKRQRGGNSETQEEKDKYLFDAIGIYDYDKVENALNNGASVNAQNNDGDTPLMQAIMIEDYDMVQLLLEQPDIDIELDLATNKELRRAEEMTPEGEEQNGIPYLIEDYIATKNQIKKQKDDNIKELSNYKRRNIPSLSTLAYQQSPSVLDTHINLNPGTINRPYRKLGGKRKTQKNNRKSRKSRKSKKKFRKTRSKKQRGGMYRNTSRPITYIACGVMYNNEGKILMGKRKANNPNYPNKWEFPGGKREDGETIFECLEREWKEEMNLFIDITPPPLVTMKCGRKICQFLVGKILNEDELELKEVTEVKYLTENEILELDDDLLLDKNDKLVIQKLINEGGVKRILYLEDLKMN